MDRQELVERARAGEHAAWDELYRSIHPKLLAYARRRLDPEPARDAVAETMARAVARIDRFTWSGGGFDAWLFGILRHVVLDVQRAAGRRPTTQLTDRPSPDAEPLAHVLDDEEAVALRAAFSRLAPAERELLELRVVAGLSSEQVAAVVGKRPGAVRMAQARALEKLRGLLVDAA